MHLSCILLLSCTSIRLMVQPKKVLHNLEVEVVDYFLKKNLIVDPCSMDSQPTIQQRRLT